MANTASRMLTYANLKFCEVWLIVLFDKEDTYKGVHDAYLDWDTARAALKDKYSVYDEDEDEFYDCYSQLIAGRIHFDNISELKPINLASVGIRQSGIRGKPARPRWDTSPWSSSTPAHDEADQKLQALNANTPALDLTSGEWVKSSEAARRESTSTAVLKALRVREDSLRNEAGTLGQDPYGRVWRREEKRQGKPTWYHLPSLLSTKRKKEGK